MTQFKAASDWSAGANNLASKDRLPKNAVRHAVNVDPLPGGTFASRAGYEPIYAGTNVRGVLALGDNLLIADGADLVEFNTQTDTSRVIRAIAATGAFVGTVMNDVLYMSTENETLEYDGTTVKTWGTPDVFNQPVVAAIAGGLLAGHYQVALTYTDQWGREGGTDRPVVLYVPDNGGVQITVGPIPAGCVANVYMGAINGSTLFLQGTRTTAGAVTVATLRDDTTQCETVLLRAPQPSTRMATHNGVILMAKGGTLSMTRPMQPHLVSRARGFVQYADDIGDVMSDGVAVFVSADKCYALTNVETDGIEQATVLEFPAIAGTSTQLPDGRVAWMTRYGQAISKNGDLELPNRQTFAPSPAASGAAGVIDTNGNQLIVTTTRGTQAGNQFAATDFYIGEILNP